MVLWRFSLVISDADGKEYQYTTEYLPVLVRRGELNNAVKAMVNYVYANQELLLLNGEPKAKSPDKFERKWLSKSLYPDYSC